MKSEEKSIAYVLSMKDGLPSFNFRELEAVEGQGYQVHIFPTKASRGIYAPKASWHVHRPRILKTPAALAYWLVARPIKFVRMFCRALGNGAIPEMALAAQFALDIKREGIPVIHCHFADRKMFTAYFCSELASVPFSVTVHSHELTFYAHRKLFSIALQKCSKVITVCDFNRNLIIEKAVVPPDKVETIRLALPFEQFEPDRRLKVLTVAKFHEYKGLDVLVEAIRALRDKPVVFWLVGDGPVDVASMAGDLIESGNLLMLGSVSEDALRILYSECDIFCLPSRTASSGQMEGLPVSIMEAMAFSKPIVSTNHAGIPELVQSVIVREKDPGALAAGIELYLENADLREKDGRRNRERVVMMHGADNIRRLVKVFEDMTARRT